MLTKLSTFRGVHSSGEPLVRLFRQGDSIDKVAGTMMPEVQDWLGTYTSDLKKIALLVNALGASEYWGQNINGDVFPWEALCHDCRTHQETWHPIDSFTGRIIPPYGYRTFLDAHAFAHHKNKDPSRAFGSVEIACLNPKMRRVELVVIVDRDQAMQFGGQYAVDRIDTGDFPDVSMGCRVPYDICTICGHKSRTRKDYCCHVREMGMNAILPDGRRVGVINIHPRFFDISFVYIGADKTAKVMFKLGSVEQDSDLWVPASVRDGERLYGVSNEDGLVKAASGHTPVARAALEIRSGGNEAGKLIKMLNPEGLKPTPEMVMCNPLQLIEEKLRNHLRNDRAGYGDGLLRTNAADGVDVEDDSAEKHKRADIIVTPELAKLAGISGLDKEKCEYHGGRWIAGSDGGHCELPRTGLLGHVLGDLESDEEPSGRETTDQIDAGAAENASEKAASWSLAMDPQTVDRAKAAIHEAPEKLRGAAATVGERGSAVLESIKRKFATVKDPGGLGRQANYDKGLAVREEMKNRMKGLTPSQQKEYRQSAIGAAQTSPQHSLGGTDWGQYKLPSPSKTAAAKKRSSPKGISAQAWDRKLEAQAQVPMGQVRKMEPGELLYHLTPEKNIKRIERHGLRPRSSRWGEGKRRPHANRVYFTTTPESAKDMLGTLKEEDVDLGGKEQGDTYTLVTVDPFKVPKMKTMVDPEEPKFSVYGTERIKPSAIVDVKRGKLQDLFGQVKKAAAKKLQKPPHRDEFPFQGQYKWNGMTILVENAAGTWRRGKGWATKMKHDYGEIKGSLGSDGDPVDVYVGPNQNAKSVFVVHQNHAHGPKADTYDEDKVMLGFNSSRAAKKAYLAHYDSPRFFRSITEMGLADFKKMVFQKENQGEKLASASKEDDQLLANLFNFTNVRRERLWKDVDSGKSTLHVGSGLGTSFATMDKTAGVDGHRGPCEADHPGMSHEEWIQSVKTAEDPLAAIFRVKDAADKRAAQFKEADIDKEIDPDVVTGRVVDDLTNSEPDLPPDLLDGMANKSLEGALSTPSMMGMVLKPKEFQRIVLTNMGESGVANDLDAKGQVFSPSEEIAAPCGPLGPDHFDSSLMKALLPMLSGRSYLGPVVKRRIIAIKISPKAPEMGSPTPIDSPLLTKVGAAYNWYRREMMKTATYAPQALSTHPALMMGVLGVDDSALFSKSANEMASANSIGAVIGSLPLTLMYSASIRRDMEKGQDPGMFKRLIAAHPNLSALGVAALVREVMKNEQVSRVVGNTARELAMVGKRILTGGA